MKVLFLNPHRSDFVFESIAYRIIKRKSLKKYDYLKRFFKNNETEFLMCYSSFYRFLNNLHMGFLDFLILWLEKRKFLSVNEIKNTLHFNISTLNKFDISFCFGFSIRELPLSELKAIADKSSKLIIHLSHYHLYADKLEQWSQIENVIFCADTNLQRNYFYNYFVNKRPPFFVLTFTIENRFILKKEWDKRNPKIVSTGTYHEFENLFNIKKLKSDPISGIFGSLSLHPERRIIAKYASKLPYLNCQNSSMGTINIFKLLTKKNSINQKKYFQFDIVTMYNDYQYSFVGEDFAGLPGIGIFESVICGCIPIINKSLYEGTPLENEKGTIGYNNINDLINTITNFDKNKIPRTNEEINKLSFKVKEFYSPDYQLNVLNNYIETFIK